MENGRRLATSSLLIFTYFRKNLITQKLLKEATCGKSSSDGVRGDLETIDCTSINFEQYVIFIVGMGFFLTWTGVS